MLNDPRLVLERLCAERGEDFAGLSRMLGRNAAYIQQFVRRGVPRRLGEEERRKLAAYFAAKSWPAQPKPAAAASPPNGIAQCQPCHQPDFAGGPPAPRLAGLSYEYLVASMRSFATDGRTNNGDMPKFMHALTDSERDAMARYLSAL